MRLSNEKSRGRRSDVTAVLLAAIVFAVSARGARAAEWGPWEERSPAPLATAARSEGTAGLPLIALIRVYQAWLSPVYGDRCPMTPSCSRYAADAIRKHGPVLGIVMTSGRLMHEADERRFAPIRTSGGRTLFFDPVENNDFWFDAR